MARLACSKLTASGYQAQLFCRSPIQKYAWLPQMVTTVWLGYCATHLGDEGFFRFQR